MKICFCLALWPVRCIVGTDSCKILETVCHKAPAVERLAFKEMDRYDAVCKSGALSANQLQNAGRLVPAGAHWLSVIGYRGFSVDGTIRAIPFHYSFIRR